ncbi:MAG TPA: iron ABC transporter permease [Nitrospiria bacterium]|nr:iron ABC transporter permease [Nitrospiria bacterium]HUK56472.1 iron ABC transporter permease [Nitrospiria bacterium]
MLTFKRWLSVLSLLGLGWMITVLICLLHGTEPIALAEAVRIFASRLSPGSGGAVDPGKGAILLDVRLPRVLLAGLVGGTLAMVGVTLQALLRNPLADPFVIGISSGTALGVVCFLLSGLSVTFWGTTASPLFGFTGGLLTLFFLYRLSRVHGRIFVQTLLLGGVIINAMLSAVIMFITYMVDADKVMGIVYWLMGNLGSLDFKALAVVALYALAGMVVLFKSARGLNLLALGDETAVTLGLDAERTKRVAFFASALLTGAVVSVSGLISFVGIMIPHVLRMVIGPDHRLLLPASVLGGGIFLMAADTIARSLISPTEIPVGVITALCGGPFFLFLLWRGRSRYWSA